MNKLLPGCILLLCIFFSQNVFAQAKISGAEEKAGNEVMLNGYPESKYYHKNISIPPDVAASDKKEDKVNVYIHNKIVDFELTQKKPLSSLAKLDMEALLRQFQDEAMATLYPESVKSPDKKEMPPAEKPAIIEGK